MAEESDDVVLQLSKTEALVLFEFVSRFSDTDVLGIQDRADRALGWANFGSRHSINA